MQECESLLRNATLGFRQKYGNSKEVRGSVSNAFLWGCVLASHNGSEADEGAKELRPKVTSPTADCNLINVSAPFETGLIHVGAAH